MESSRWGRRRPHLSRHRTCGSASGGSRRREHKIAFKKALVASLLQILIGDSPSQSRKPRSIPGPVLARNHSPRQPRPDTCVSQVSHPIGVCLPLLPPVSVRRVVTVAPASFRPHLTATPLPSLNGSDFLYRRELAPPRTSTCLAYQKRRAEAEPPPSLLLISNALEPTRQESHTSVQGAPP